MGKKPKKRTRPPTPEEPAPVKLAGDGKHVLAVGLAGLQGWREADAKLSDRFFRGAQKEQQLLDKLAGSAAMLAAAALRASRLADSRQYQCLADAPDMPQPVICCPTCGTKFRPRKCIGCSQGR